MFTHHFKTAVRNLRAGSLFSLINIIGLAIGISASLVIYLIVQYDFSFDLFEKDTNRIYRVVSDYSFAGKSFHDSGVPDAMPAAIGQNISGLDIVAPFRLWNDGVKLTVPDTPRPKMFKNEKDIIFADKNYFKLVRYQWIAGDAISSTSKPYQTVITETTAKRLFAGLTTNEILGREIDFNDSIRTTVTGIIKDLRQHSDFSFKIFVSRATILIPRLKPDDGDGWGSTSPSSQLFIKLSEHMTATQADAQINLIFEKYNTQHLEAAVVKHRLQPLGDLHFNSNYGNFDQRTAHKPTLYGLLTIDVFLLLLACINFVNLTTAKASQRAKEIGIRKTLGGSKKQLVFQFLSETFLLTATAAVLSIAITPLLLKIFADFIPHELHFNIFKQPSVFIFLLALILSVTVLAGFYPAIVLSAYKPVIALKNISSNTMGGTWRETLRKTMTVFQFAAAQAFIIATILVSRQINYTFKKDLGFAKKAIICFGTSWRDTLSRRFVLLDKLKTMPEISMVSLSNNPPTSVADRGTIVRYKDHGKVTSAHAEVKLVDTNYIKLYNIKLLAGTNIPYSLKIKNVLINETGARALGFQNPPDIVGKNIESESNLLPVVGVIKDFHQKSLHETIGPLIISSKTGEQLCFNVGLKSENEGTMSWKSAIEKIQTAFKEVFPEDEFNYSFLDEAISKYYTADQNTARLLAGATALTIFISCLGLLGLVIFTTNQRTKEIGIRKVIGASAFQLIILLCGDFLKLIFVAIVIAGPIAWWGSHVWLQQFAYRTNVSWWIFPEGCAIMLMMATLLIGAYTRKVANTNPATILRAE